MEYVIKTYYGAFIDDKGDYVDFVMTSVACARKYKLSEAIAVKENHEDVFRKYKCEIFESELSLGAKVNL